MIGALKERRMRTLCRRGKGKIRKFAKNLENS